MGKLFKPFHSTKPGRAGVGLSVARRIAELHAGSILLRGGARGGTEAVLSLPAGEGREPRSGTP
jgi:two-component system sensor kinase FixL